MANYINENYSIDIDRIFFHSSVDFQFKQWLNQLIAPKRSERFSNAATARQALLEVNTDTPTVDSVYLFKLNSTSKKIAILAVAGMSLGAIGFRIVTLLNPSVNIYVARSLAKVIFKTANIIAVIIIFSSLAFGVWANSEGFSLEESFSPLAASLFTSIMYIIILRFIVF